MPWKVTRARTAPDLWTRLRTSTTRHFRSNSVGLRAFMHPRRAHTLTTDSSTPGTHPWLDTHAHTAMSRLLLTRGARAAGERRRRRSEVPSDGKVRFDPSFNGSRPYLPLNHLGSVGLDPFPDYRSGPCSREVRTAPLAPIHGDVLGDGAGVGADLYGDAARLGPRPGAHAKGQRVILLPARVAVQAGWHR